VHYILNLNDLSRSSALALFPTSSLRIARICNCVRYLTKSDRESGNHVSIPQLCLATQCRGRCAVSQQGRFETVMFQADVWLQPVAAAAQEGVGARVIMHNYGTPHAPNTQCLSPAFNMCSWHHCAWLVGGCCLSEEQEPCGVHL
jgi:hypothetical protein